MLINVIREMSTACVSSDLFMLPRLEKGKGGDGKGGKRKKEMEERDLEGRTT